MPLVPENIMSEGPNGRQDVHNSGVDTQLAAARLCGQTDLRTADVHKVGSSRRDVRVPSERRRTGRRG
jgi:hypothetical protein